MIKPTIRIYETDGTFIDREMNENEFAQYEKDQATELVRKAEAEAKAQAKAELLERLGITADEAKLLLA
jgi:predicted metal-binding transcription factor (methanogenesis marker protein 9)